MGALMSYSCPLRCKMVPGAEPEEDIHVPETAIEDDMLPKNKVILRSETADATKLENQKSTRILEVTELEQVAKLSRELKTWDEFTSLLLSGDFVREDCFEWFSHLWGVGSEFIKNDEIIPDRAENENVISLNLQNTGQHKERLERKVYPSKDMTGEDVAEDENIIELSPVSILEEEINKSRGASVE